MCFAMFLNTGVMAFAQENSYIQPRYTYIMDFSLSLNIANDNAHISADLNGKTGTTESYIKCNLEKLTGTYWMQIQSFSSTGDIATVLVADYPVGRGTYRVMGTFRCNNETQTAYSGNWTY